MKRRDRVSLVKVLFIIFCFMLPSVMDFFSNEYNIYLEDYLFKFYMIICILAVFAMLFILFDKKIVVPRKLKRVAAEDLELIQQFNKIHMSDVPDVLDDYIESVLFLCSDFLKMKRNVFEKEIFEYEFLLKEIDGNVELLIWYNKAKKVVETVFKYYDDNGKIKKF